MGLRKSGYKFMCVLIGVISSHKYSGATLIITIVTKFHNPLSRLSTLNP